MQIVLINIGLLLIACIIAVIFFYGNQKKIRKTVGVIINGSVTDEGWNSHNMEGIMEAAKESDVQVLIEENIQDYTDTCDEAIERLIGKGAEMIILTSYGYANEASVQQCFEKYPNIEFRSNSFDVEGTNVSGYFPRMYEGRFLAGILAGSMSKTGTLGYVAAMPNHEVNRGINAFTLGARSVNPDAKVIVYWTDSWCDEEREKNAAKTLVESGADLLTFHQNWPYAGDMAEELDVDYISYHNPPKQATKHCLTTIMCDWKQIYANVLKTNLDKSRPARDQFYFGIATKTVYLSDYSEKVPEKVRDLIAQKTQNIQDGTDIFRDEIKDMDGNLRCEEGENIGDSALLEAMDWYVEGVEFYE